MSKQEDKKGKFEQSWEAAFSGAKVTPPSSIWNEIDHSLTQTQLIGLQKKTVIYKWTAAAAVIFAVSLAALALSLNFEDVVTWLGFDASDQNTLTLSEDKNESTGNYAGFSILRLNTDTNDEGKDVTPKSQTQPLSVALSKIDTPGGKTIATRPTYSTIAGLSATDQPFGSMLDDIAVSSISLYRPMSKRPSNAILFGKPVNQLLAVNVPDPAAFGVNGVMVNEVKRKVLNGKSKTRFWSGVDFASGYFNPNYAPGNQITSQEQAIQDAANREAIPELSQNISGGASYSVGVNFGMELKNRWSVEVGVLYSLLGARTFTNLILESEGFNKAVAYSSEIAGLESVANLVESELTKLSVDDIQINNTFQFVSIPVQAGYKLIDKRFNVTLNGGLAANLYLGNSLRGRQNFSSFELEPGRRSPYRSLTIAAVTGFEVGYWIHRRVNLSFEPTYQKNLQSLTKNDAAFVANPSGIGVQVGFKYDF
ncbi:MAG: outer membrane beta-barrel protein [Cytophagales bacterium]|nr:outer membrane beta-barrel protein [Cytophagales bacterium]